MMGESRIMRTSRKGSILLSNPRGRKSGGVKYASLAGNIDL